MQHDKRQLIKHGFRGILSSFLWSWGFLFVFFSMLNFSANKPDKKALHIFEEKWKEQM